jgi:hypothetical protein
MPGGLECSFGKKWLVNMHVHVHMESHVALIDNANVVNTVVRRFNIESMNRFRIILKSHFSPFNILQVAYTPRSAERLQQLILFDFQ